MKDFSLHFYSDEGINLSFSIRPFAGLEEEYRLMSEPFSLKTDLHWKERRDLQNVVRKTEIWSNIILDGLLLIKDEVILEEYNQRIDLLYLNRIGEIVICELKIGGEAMDVIGQLLRYIADMQVNPIDIKQVRKLYVDRTSGYYDPLRIDDRHVVIAESEFDKYIASNKITSASVNIRKGIVMDEPIRMLNTDFGTEYIVYSYSAYTNTDGRNNGYSRFRIDFTRVL
jgi:hypothetical protein